MKNFFTYVATFFMVANIYVDIDACTNLIVTKGASTDGSVMITYSADSYNFYGELYHYKAAVYPEGANGIRANF